MFDAVLFDLDGTLLDIDVDSFLSDYFGALGPVLADLLSERDPRVALRPLLAATDAMCAEHAGRTNRDVFEAAFLEMTEVDLADAGAATVIDEFYATAFPALQGPHGPRVGGRAALDAAMASGAVTVLATNPIFPEAAIRERMRWAGVHEHPFAHVTTYETSTACKPHLEYFLEIARTLGVDPERCLFVGDDAGLDLPARHTGMKTFYVGYGDGADADWAGDLDGVAALLRGHTAR